MIIAPLIPIEKFSRKGKCLIIEVSELSSYTRLSWTRGDCGWKPGVPGYQIYDDACDFGLVVKGVRETVIFTYSHDDVSGRDGDLEVTGWRYVSSCERFTILIIND
jgi:hypothetical protein